MAADSNLKYPFGAADAQTPDYAASLDQDITNDVKTHIVIDDMSGDLTLNLNAASQLNAGAKVLVALTNTDTTSNSVTLGGDASGTVAAVAAGDTDLVMLEYIDGGFKVVSQQTQ